MARPNQTVFFFLMLLAAGASPASAAQILPPLDPALILPPPPAPESPAGKNQMAELQAILAKRTPAQFAKARADSDREDPTLYEEALGPYFSLKKLPATATLLNDVEAEAKVDYKAAKTHFGRLRPWAIDKSIKACEDTSEDKPNSSYPSGHSTIGFSVGVVLAALLPGKAEIIFRRASDYAENRLVCGVHFRGDIVAGQVLGTLVGERVLADPKFRAEYAAAATELKAAHIQ